MKWVTMWGNAQSKVVPQPAIYAKDITIRYPIFIPFDGSMVSITLDNFCCSEDVVIDRVSLGISSMLSDVEEEFISYLTFNNKESVTIKKHSLVKSDPIKVNLESDKYLIVTMYLKGYTNLTSGVDIIGPLSKGYFCYGNEIGKKKFDINKYKSTSWVYFLANVDIYTDDDNYAVICYGDSITSQDWPDYMLLKLREYNHKNISIVRKAVSGTRVLREYDCMLYQSYGLKGEKRFLHEVSSVLGAKKIIVQQGINDIIHPVGEDINIYRPLSDLPTKDELISGIKYYYDNAKKLNLEFICGTLLPIYNWRTYEDFREELKNSFNEELMKLFDYIDFSKVVGINDNGIWKFKEGFDSGDHLHPSKYAYSMMGEEAAKKIIEK